MSVSAFVFLLILAFLAVVGFLGYFFVKYLDFVVNATRLYRRMIVRQDTIIKLLVDIRDNTRKVGEEELTSLDQIADDEVGGAQPVNAELRDYVASTLPGGSDRWECPSCGAVNGPARVACHSCRKPRKT